MAADPPAPLVWLVDDDDGFREATAWLLRTVGVEVRAFADADSFLSAFDESRPGCIVCDLRMPESSGLSLQKRLRPRSPIPILFVSAFGQVRSAVEAMRAGAVDFLEKPVDDDLLIDRVQAALRLDVERRDREAALASWRERLSTLTERERDVLPLALAGRMGKEIAHRLGISVKTVEIHKTSILRKLDARSWMTLSHDVPDDLREEIGSAGD